MKQAMTMIDTGCPHCGKDMQIPPHYEGREVTCPACDNHFTAKRLTTKEQTQLRFLAEARRINQKATPAAASASAPVASSIYVLINNQQQGPYAIDQIHGMWNSGSITADTLFWQEGMTEWEPVQALIAHEHVPLRHTAVAVTRTASPQSQESTPKSDLMGIVLFLLPIASAALMWFWISQMNLLQNPSATLGLIGIGTVLLTSALMAVEASQLGMGGLRDGKRTTSPVMWFIGGVALWIITYPVYLYERSRFGLTNYCVGGILSCLIFTGVMLTLNGAIDSRKSEVRREADKIQENLREVQRSLERFSR